MIGSKRRRLWSPAVMVTAVTLIATAASANAATITVNDGGDTTADDGACTLREAITAANTNAASGATPGECAAGEDGPAVRDAIQFGLTAGFHVISPGSALPVATDTVEIDGTNGAAGARIRIDGTSAGALAKGLVITTGSDGSYVHDLAITNFDTDGLYLFASSNVAEDVVSGTNLAGTDATMGNGDNGIEVLGDDNQILASVASANAHDGVFIDYRADGTSITGSRIGTTRDGTADLGNAFNGITIASASLEAANDTRIGGATGLTAGGDCTGDCNVIAGNNLDGIQESSALIPITGTEIIGNHIGTDRAGTAAVANGRDGIIVQGVIQATSISRNQVGGNAADGILISPTSTTGVAVGPADTTIAGNLIGVDAAGSAALGNGDRGIRVVSDVTSGFDPIRGTVIGGSTGLSADDCTGDCNVISASGTFGVELVGNVDGTQVLGNKIGTDANGTIDLGNQQAGVGVGGADTTVIGVPGGGNVISGNATAGIQISDATGATIQGNLVGVGADGTAALGNTLAGVQLLTGTNGVEVGGIASGATNVVAHNHADGVDVAGGAPGAQENSVLRNSIFANGGLGIDLGAVLGSGDGVTANDGPGDADTGGNGLQNFPDLRAAVADQGADTTRVIGSLESAASTAFRVEVFASGSPDPSGHGEGELYLGATTVATDPSGHAEIDVTLPSAASPGAAVSATATELGPGGAPLGTSEFAGNVSEGCSSTATSGDDVICGTAGKDTIDGGAGDDIILAGGGKDTISGGSGDDIIDGGTGEDTADYSSSAAGVEADLGAGSATGDGTDTLQGIEDVTGSSHGDDLTGDGAANVLKGADGRDEINGGDTADVLKGGKGADTISGGKGADTVEGDEKADTLDGGKGADDVEGGGGKDVAKGDSGSDSVHGGGANDTVKGGDGGDDKVKGGDGKDTLDGGEGKGDVCDGGAGKDAKTHKGCEKVKSIP